MKKTIFSKAIAILGSIAMLVGVAACGQSNGSTKTAADGNGLTKVTFMLSWAPDTNHIGVYVAKNKGYFSSRPVLTWTSWRWRRPARSRP